MDMDFFDVSFEESLDEQLVNAILDVGRDIRRLFEGKESQSRILMILRLHGAVTQKMLIQILHIQPGSASEILKKMEKAGLIIRVPNEMNRRASDIVLTRQGRSVSEKLIEQRRGRYREMMARLAEDEKSRILYKSGKPIDLTQVEFQIMELFFRNPGTALVREKILEGVWGKNYFGDVKIVDVNIRRLRMKIEDEPSSPQHILTVWGYGYRWNA